VDELERILERDLRQLSGDGSAIQRLPRSSARPSSSDLSPSSIPTGLVKPQELSRRTSYIAREDRDTHKASSACEENPCGYASSADAAEQTERLSPEAAGVPSLPEVEPVLSQR
jgi:hypothetical protein